MNIKQISKKLNLSPRRVQQLVKAGVFKETARGECDLLECALSYCVFLRRGSCCDAEFILTTRDIARATNLTPGHVRALEQIGIFKKASHGRFFLIESMRHYTVYIENKYHRRKKDVQVYTTEGSPRAQAIAGSQVTQEKDGILR